jgi:7-carboxy-7-deazaguanine synthase
MQPVNEKKLLISEIYLSIQGESSYTGLACTFIRLTGCPLRCRWCDTSYSFTGGNQCSFNEIIKKVNAFSSKHVEITGGEPLAQSNTIDLMHELIKLKYKVLLETGGSITIKTVPKEVHIIMDIKCPGSKMEQHNLYTNIEKLKPSDEVKFVIANKDDFIWTTETIKKYNIDQKAKILLSPAWGLLQPKLLVEWMLKIDIECRLNLQVHKWIWSPKQKGV